MDNKAPPVLERSQSAMPLAVRSQNAAVFVKDPDSESVIRQALGNAGVRDVEFMGGGVVKAIAELTRKPSPRLLFVDISGVDDAASKLFELSEVCEPGTDVIVVGDRNDIALYRQVKSTGIAEYFFKPLVSTLVEQACERIVSGKVEQTGPRLGKLIFMMSLGGGAGATTVAANVAWHLAERLQRQVMMLDLNVTDGDAALQLNARPTGALGEALEHPERVDDLFLERAVIRVTDRLHLMATLQPLTGTLVPEEKAVSLLLQNLLRRYRYVIVDMPPSLAPKMAGPLHMPSTFILISNASLLAARDLPRWRELVGFATPDRSLVHVLNKAGGHGSLPLADFVAAAGRSPDIVLPYDRELGVASALGIAAVQKCSHFQRSLLPLSRRLSGEQVKETPSLLGRLFSWT